MMNNQNNPYSGMQNIFGANCPQETEYWRQYRKGMQAMTENKIIRRHHLQSMSAQNAIDGWVALEKMARAIKPKKPLNFSARADKRRQSIHITPGHRVMGSQEIKTAHDLACGSGQYAAIWVPITYAGRAAIARATARTKKEVKVADLMVFVAKYREKQPGAVIFPAWLSEDGRKRLLDIANRR